MTAFFQQLVQFGLYKRTQGRIARQATFIALLVILALGAWTLYNWLGAQNGGTAAWAWPLGILALGTWIAFRLIQLPIFADFLISVEAEMNKVSWPSQRELLRSSTVVILMIFFLALLLAVYDFVLQSIPVLWNTIVARLVS